MLRAGEPADAEQEAGGQESGIEKRVVGTAVWAPRHDFARRSSALELFDSEVVEMRDKSLDFIRKSQHQSGGWGDKSFQENAGVTALCCLALLSEGSLPRIGPSGRELDRGVQFLLDHVKDDGQIAAKNTYKYGPMYGHAWSTLVLLQVYGNIPWRLDMRDKLAKALQVLLESQKVDGGWRYTMMREGESDTLVTLNVVFTLRVAIKAGFAVPEDVLQKAVAFIESNGVVDSSGTPDGTFYYKTRGSVGSPAIAACGNIAIHGTGRFDHPLVLASRDYIQHYYQRYSTADIAHSEYPHYRTFYTSIAMYQAGDDYWVPYYRKLTKLWQETQQADGQFFNHSGNYVYPTACAAIVMQAPLGYLPFYYR
jgi:hypothetical protein